MSANAKWLASVVKEVDLPNCGTLPDFGGTWKDDVNFNLGGGRQYDAYKGIAELMHFAKSVSAKSVDSDEQGNEMHTDYVHMMKIVLDSGYRGHISIEYMKYRSVRKHSEIEGIKLTKKLLENVRERLS